MEECQELNWNWLSKPILQSAFHSALGQRECRHKIPNFHHYIMEIFYYNWSLRPTFIASKITIKVRKYNSFKMFLFIFIFIPCNSLMIGYCRTCCYSNTSGNRHINKARRHNLNTQTHAVTTPNIEY